MSKLNGGYEAFSLLFALLVSWVIITYGFELVWSYEIPLAFYFSYKAINYLGVKKKMSKKIGVR